MGFLWLTDIHVEALKITSQALFDSDLNFIFYRQDFGGAHWEVNGDFLRVFLSFIGVHFFVTVAVLNELFINLRFFGVGSILHWLDLLVF